MEKKRTVFLTGATGLVGSYLLKVLLENGYMVYILARDKNNKSPRQRVEGILNFWDESILRKKIKNLIVINGDISKEDLGLGDKKNILADEIEEIFHCAAETHFNLSIDSIRQVNVQGTKHLLDFALRCKVLRKINYISTVFICGNYQGIFKESCLDVGQKFNTTYEQSKFEAEQIVDKYRQRGLSVDIYRPPIVVGDSVTGKTPFFQGFYQTLRLWMSEVFNVFPGKGVQVYLVPVDTLINSIMALNHLNCANNNTYHPFSSKAISLEEILKIAHALIKFQKPILVSFSDFDINSLTATQRLILKSNIEAFNPHAAFSSHETIKKLKQNRFIVSDVSEDLIKKLILYALKVNFKNYS